MWVHNLSSGTRFQIDSRLHLVPGGVTSSPQTAPLGIALLEMLHATTDPKFRSLLKDEKAGSSKAVTGKRAGSKSELISEADDVVDKSKVEPTTGGEEAPGDQDAPPTPMMKPQLDAHKGGAAGERDAPPTPGMKPPLDAPKGETVT